MFSTSFFVTSISKSFFINIWHLLDNKIFHAKTILTDNLDKSDLNSTVKVQIFIGRYFSRLYFEIIQFQYVLLKNREVFLSKFIIFQIRYRLRK